MFRTRQTIPKDSSELCSEISGVKRSDSTFFMYFNETVDEDDGQIYGNYDTDIKRLTEELDIDFRSISQIWYWVPGDKWYCGVNMGRVPRFNDHAMLNRKPLTVQSLVDIHTRLCAYFSLFNEGKNEEQVEGGGVSGLQV